MEDWKDIPGYENKYQASTLGRIKSISREIQCPYRKRKVKAKFLKLNLNSKNYFTVSLHFNGQKTFQVHTLIAMSFLNFKPCASILHVDHIDGNPLNNKVTNLQILSPREHQNKTKGSKYPGITYRKKVNKWEAQISIDKKAYYLGRFSTPEEASNVYKEAVFNLKN